MSNRMWMPTLIGMGILLTPLTEATPVDVDGDGIVGPQEAIDLAENWKGPAATQGGIQPWQIDGTTIYYNSGNVGIGTSTPNQPLDVTNPRSIGAAIYGYVPSATGLNVGVWGVTESTDGFGVAGWARGNTGENVGVDGQSDSVDGTGVHGLATPTMGVNQGVHGETNSREGRGVLGEASFPTGLNYGVYGRTFSASGTGVFGEATRNFGITYGVRGRSNSPEGFDFYADGAGEDYMSASSIRWKRNVEKIEEPLEKVSRLRGVTFDWDADHGGKHDVGMIAEEVGVVLPEVVAYEENGIDAIGIDYGRMTALLVEAVKGLRAEKDREIARKDAELAELKDRVSKLEEIVDRLANGTEKVASR
ncbi:MAG: tail fiber domain-containing protein [Candidatus Omnitrophica bacterium]|nr:tail fiber domain-containing protein [Candidatus Omnitrophota bacterium]